MREGWTGGGRERWREGRGSWHSGREREETRNGRVTGKTDDQVEEEEVEGVVVVVVEDGLLMWSYGKKGACWVRRWRIREGEE